MKVLITIETLDRAHSQQFYLDHEPDLPERHKLSSQYADAWKKNVEIRWQRLTWWEEFKEKFRALVNRY